jgi:hypothetical protein
MAESDDQLQENALSGTAPAEHCQRLAANDRQVHSVQNMLWAKRFVDISKDHYRLTEGAERLMAIQSGLH